MIMLGILLVILGALALIAGILILGGLLVFAFFGDGAVTIGVSMIFFGALALVVGIMMLLSSKNEKARHSVKKIVNMKEFTLIIALAIVVYIFWAINHNYLSLINIRNIFNSAFVMGAIAVGLSCLLISGEIDLSAGNTGMLAGVFVALLIKGGMPWVPAFVITLAFGAATGLINAFFVNGLKFVAFISTLAVSAVYGGLALVITNAQNIPIGNKSFISIGSINLLNTFPLPFVVMVILLVAYGVVLHFTGFGRRTYMVGGNASAARLAGINPKKITTILFVNNGVIASIAGLFFASRMNMGSPSAITGSDLDAVTAAVLGGIAFTGGAGNMFGVFIGIMLIISFQNGIVVVGLDSYYQVVSKGLLLVAALMMDYFREKSRLKALKEERG